MKPESTIMRICNDAQRFVNDIDSKMQQKNQPEEPPIFERPSQPTELLKPKPAAV